MSGIKRITDLPIASPVIGDELFEISQLSTSVRISAATISAQASDNSYNDSGLGFVTAGFTVGDRVKVTGFTGDVANNILVGIVTAVTAGKLTIGGIDGDVIADDAEGETVVIAKWTSKRIQMNLVGGGGGGGAVAVEEEGTEVIAIASRLNFVGNFVTVTDAGSGEATITHKAPYDIRMGFITTPTTNQVVDTIPITRNLVIPANMVGSVGRVGTNPTATFAATIRKNGTTVATISISTFGVFTLTTVSGLAQTFAPGDVMTLQGPSTVDATVANLVFVLLGETS